MAFVARFLTAVLPVILFASCDGRPKPPDFVSYFTTTTSIRVEWNQTSVPQGETVLGFRVHYRQGAKGKLVKNKVNSASARQFDIQDLGSPCGQYRVRMGTESSDGLGRYTSYSDVEKIRGPPQNINVFPSADTSARVSWAPPTNSPCIGGYRLSHGPSSDELESMVLPAELNQYLLVGLQPGTSYFLTLAPVADGAAGMEGYFQWYQAGLPQAPGNLNASPTSPTSAVVTWVAASSGISYTYSFSRLEGLQIGMSSGEITTASPMVELQELEPDGTYAISVSAISSIGHSAPASVEWRQPQAPAVIEEKPVVLPSAPRMVNVASISAGRALVSWSRPVGDAPIEGWIIGFGLSGAAVQDMAQFSVAAEDLEYIITDLKEGSSYLVNVLAYNADGDGRSANAEWFQSSPPLQLVVPTQPRGVLVYSSSPTSISVSWMLSETSEQIEGFTVTYGTSAAAETSMRVSSASDTAEIQNLKPDTYYYVALYSFNSAGRSQPVHRSVQTLTPPPDDSCSQQVQCTVLFRSLRRGPDQVCPRIFRYLNCLQKLRQTCQNDIGYTSRLASVREMFLRQVCSMRGPAPLDRPVPATRSPPAVTTGPVAPAQPYSPRQPAALGRGNIPGQINVPEVISVPTNLQSTLLSPTSVRLTWTDESLGESQLINDGRFYNIMYRPVSDEEYLELRTPETSFVADFLLPGVPYEFGVQLVLDPTRRSEVSPFITVVSRDPSEGMIPQRFSILQVAVSNPNSAKAVMNWLPPPDRRNDVTEYLIEYTASESYLDPETVWDTVTVDGSKLAAAVGGLTLDQEYHARISAVFVGGERGPKQASPSEFSTPVVPESANSGKQCSETQEEAVARRVNFLWDETVDGTQRPPLYGVPIPFCEDNFSLEECHGIFCFCVPGTRPPALRDPGCSDNGPPCRREYDLARKALDEGRQAGLPVASAQLPHCREDGYYGPKQCSGTMCYCVDQLGAHTGRERPMWEGSQLRCE